MSGNYNKSIVKNTPVHIAKEAVWVLIIGVFLSLFITYRYHIHQVEDRKQLVNRVGLNQLSLLQLNIARSLNVTNAIAALVRQGNGTVKDFELVGQEILNLYPEVGAVQLAPDGVIRQIVPLIGNENILGHDLLADSSRNKEAFLAKDTEKLTLAGPFELIEGGLGAVGHFPVYITDENGTAKFWGFTTVLLSIPKLLAASEIDTLYDRGYHFKLWREHPDSGEPSVIDFSGDGSLRDPLRISMKVPNGEWFLDIQPITGWATPLPTFIAFLACTIISLLLSLLMHNLRRLPDVLQQEIRKRTKKLHLVTQRLNEAQHLAKVGSWELDLITNKLTWSDEIYSIFGIDKDRLSASYDNFLAAIHPDDRQKVDEAYKNSLINRNSYSISHRVLMADGHIKYVIERCDTDFDIDGHPLRSIGTIQDITEIKETEIALIDERQRLSDIIWGTGAGTWEWNIETNETRFNERWAEIAGYTLEELEPINYDTWMNLSHPEDLERSRVELNAYLDGKTESFESEIRVKHKNGYWVWVLSRGKVISRGKNDKPQWMYGTHTDITYNKFMTQGMAAISRELAPLKGVQFYEAVSRYISEALGQEYAYIGLVDDNIENINIVAGWDINKPLERSSFKIKGTPSERVIRNNSISYAHGVREDFPHDKHMARTHIESYFGRRLLDKQGSTLGVLVVLGTGYIINPKLIDNLLELFVDRVSAEIVRERDDSKLKQSASVFEHANEGIMITDTEGKILDVNDAFCRISGYDREEAINQTLRLLKSELQSSDYYESMWSELNANGHWSSEVWHRRKNGSFYAVIETISAVYNEQNEISQFVALMSDITPLKEQQKRLEHIAHYDPLTKLPNRSLLLDRLNWAMKQAHRRKSKLGVVYLDLDGFKAINDQHGHDRGDLLLEVVAKRMQEALREGDTLARIGGDEFVALLLDLDTTEQSKPILQRLLDAVAQPVLIEDLHLQVSVSIGATVFPPSSDLELSALMRQADSAMYLSKQEGKNRYHFFTHNSESEL